MCPFINAIYAAICSVLRARNSQRIGGIAGEEIDGAGQDVDLRQIEQRVHDVDARVVQRDERVGVHLVDLGPGRRDTGSDAAQGQVGWGP